MKRARYQRRAHRGDELTEHVRRVVHVNCGGLERTVRMRRPSGWSRDDFERWVRLGQHRAFWTFTFEGMSGDVVILEVLDGLFAEEGGNASA